ncbi:MAG: DUF72 domain-containing protein [Caulobacter sp.]|nr:DUF72 domain-containing protein [Caulobacter sp.]
MTGDVRIGTAGWSIPKAVADAFPMGGTGLQRYAARFPIVEINSTFYRSHKPTTYARWANDTPDDFRFAMKCPKTITHEARLKGCDQLMARFLGGAEALGGKFRVLLVQLPPSLPFEPAVVEPFFAKLRDLEGERHVVCEPRHASWFGDEADALLDGVRIARVAADPAPHRGAAEPGGWRGFTYIRLHGSPRMYYSSYAGERLGEIAKRLSRRASDTWCVFDNTASGAAVADALELHDLLRVKSLHDLPQALDLRR